MPIWRLLLVLGLFTLVTAQNHKKSNPSIVKPCTQMEAEKALNGIDHLRTWADLHRAFKDFGHCDDGAIAEGFSDKTVTLLAHEWKSIQVLNRHVHTDGKFSAFIIRHIDETTPRDALLMIQKNAQTNCPREAKALCKTIEARVSQLQVN